MRKKFINNASTIFYKMIVALIITAFLSSCANPPIRDSLRKGPGYADTIEKISTIAVISDMTIRIQSRFAVNDYICIESSIKAESYLLDSSVKSIEDKGYKVVYKKSPFVGGIYPSDENYYVSFNQGKDLTKQKAPFYTEDVLSSDSTYQKALHLIMVGLFNRMKLLNLGGGTASDYYLSGKEAADNLKIISERTKADAVLFIIGDGVKFTAADMCWKSAVLCGCCLIGLPLGIGPTHIPPPGMYSFFNTWSALVNLKTGEITWTYQLFVDENPADKNSYNSIKWADRLFYYFNKKINIKTGNDRL